MFSKQTTISLKEIHFTTRNGLHYGQCFQQKAAAPTKMNDFHWKEWLQLQALVSLQEMFSLKEMNSTKRTSFDFRERISLKGKEST